MRASRTGFSGLACVASLGLILAETHCIAAEPPRVEAYLIEGRLQDGIKDLTARVAQNPQDNEARFGLGVAQFLRGVERMSQSFYRYGLYNNIGQVPFLRMPVPKNVNPNQVSYQDVRKILQDFIDDATLSEGTLAKVTDPSVKLPLHFGQIRLDFDGDGKAGEDEALWRMYTRVNPAAGRANQQAQELVIGFDAADVQWLRGYCHLLMSLAEMALAHDAQELFDRSAHLYFTNPKTPFPFLKHPDHFRFSFENIADLVAMIHLINLPVIEPERMKRALDHLHAMTERSREMWKVCQAEKDDDHEWIPSPGQTGVIPGVRVTEDMVKGWHEFLDEVDALLDGKKLLPFWRNANGQGVNLKRVFTEPRRFDLVMWVQGTGAAPYLEEGPVTKPDTWQRLDRLFRGQFIGFAIWFN